LFLIIISLNSFNTNVDLIVSAIELFQRLNLTSNLECCVDHKIITSLNDFKQLFSYFFRRGSAAERFFLNKNDFMRVIEATESIDKKVSLILCFLKRLSFK
jgi:ADP-dependent glucokinase